MSSDSDSDVFNFSPDLNKYMSKGQNKLWENYKARRNKIISEETREPETHITVNNNEFRIEEATSLDDKSVEIGSTSVTTIAKVPVNNNEFITPKTTSVNDKTAETKFSSETTIAKRPVYSNLIELGTILNKLTELSETVEVLQDNVQQTKRKTLTRGRKKRAAPVKRKSVKRQVQNNIPLLTVDSSDDEVSTAPPLENDTEGPSKSNELNPTLTVKVLWKSVENKIFKVRKFQSLVCIHKYFANEAKVDPKLLFFTIDDKHVDLQDNSYVSLRFNNTKLIEGGVLPISYLDKPIPCLKLGDKDLLKFKVQFVALRKKEEFTVSGKHSDKIEFLLWQVMKELNMLVEDFKLYFDGQLLKASDTISDLCLEEGDCFDLQVI